MDYVFGENMFLKYSKQELEAMFKDMRKFEKNGLIPNCFIIEENKIRSLFKWLDHPSSFELAEKEFFDEIARRYFSDKEA